MKKSCKDPIHAMLEAYGIQKAKHLFDLFRSMSHYSHSHLLADVSDNRLDIHQTM